MLVTHLRTAYDARHLAIVNGAGLRIAKRKHVSADLSAEIPISIDEYGIAMIRSGQLSDEWLLRLLAATRKYSNPQSAGPLAA